MKIKTTCKCRGNGKAYIEMHLSDLSDKAILALSGKTQDNKPVPVKYIELNKDSNSRRIVVAIPLLECSFSLSISTTSSDAAQIPINPEQLKWQSRLNYRLRNKTCTQIRDADESFFYTQPSIEIKECIPGEQQNTVRGVLHLPSKQESSALSNLVFLDEKLEKIDIKPILMGHCFQSLEEGISYSMTAIEFSIHLSTTINNCLFVYKDPESNILGFTSLDQGRRDYLINKFRQETLTSEGDPNYHSWFIKNKPWEAELIRQSKIQYPDPIITFSIVVPLYKTPLNLLNAMIESVLNQTYKHFELILVNASPDHKALTYQIKKLSETDNRIKIVTLDTNLGIYHNTSEGIVSAQNDYVCFLDHDDIIEPNALYEYAKAIRKNPSISLLYCDEDKLLPDGHFANPYFKPDYSKYLLREINYICHFLALKREVLIKSIKPNEVYNGAQDRDIIYKCLENECVVYHVPKVLYHWRITKDSTASGTAAKPYADQAGYLAVAEHLKNMGINAIIHKTENACCYSIEYIPDNDPLVSIIIPNKDNSKILKQCIESIISKSTYPNFEILIIENNSTEPETFSYYKELQENIDKVRVVTWEHEFNYSKINNFGAHFANGDYLLFLNNDTEVITPNWIEEMLGICQDKDVGAVGAKLLYPDGLIQHAGVFVQGKGAGHLNSNLNQNDPGYFSTAITTHELSAVTGACMMVKCSIFEKVGGFTEQLAVAFNDVDLCLKIRALNKSIIYTPRAKLYHYESLSRGYETTPEKQLRFHKETARLNYLWPEYFVNGDPFLNPNLNIDSGYYKLKELTD